LKATHLSEATVYSIVTVPIVNDAGRNLGGEHALETISSSTGGRVFLPALGKELDKAFTDILRDLRSQYLIAYPARNLPADAPAFHPVKVEITRPELRESLHVSTRSGYYEDAARR
jgi:Ca-activated chloride channel family protein